MKFIIYRRGTLFSSRDILDIYVKYVSIFCHNSLIAADTIIEPQPVTPRRNNMQVTSREFTLFKMKNHIILKNISLKKKNKFKSYTM